MVSNESEQAMDAAMALGDQAESFFQNLTRVFQNTKAQYLSLEARTNPNTLTEEDNGQNSWHENIAVNEDLLILAEQLRRLRNQVQRFSSFGPNPNSLPTTNSIIDRAMRDTNNLGMFIFLNLTTLNVAARKIAEEMWAADGDADAMNQGVRVIVDELDRNFKQQDVSTDNLISNIDLMDRSEREWRYYHLKEKLEDVSTGCTRLSNIFRVLHVGAAPGRVSGHDQVDEYFDDYHGDDGY